MNLLIPKIFLMVSFNEPENITQLKYESVNCKSCNNCNLTLSFNQIKSPATILQQIFKTMKNNEEV